MQKRSICVLAVSALGLTLALAYSGERAQAQGIDATKPLEARVAELEKILANNIADQDRTVLSRLGRVERSLQADTKTRKDGDDADAKTFDELKANYVKAQREFDSYDRRLRAMEAKRIDEIGDEMAKDVKALRREVDGQNTTLRDVNERLRRVESKVR